MTERAMLDRPRQQSSWSVRPSDSGIDRFASGTAANVLWLVARCLIGGLFVQGGGVKLMALDAFAASLAKNGVPMADIAAAIGAAVEFGGGLAIVVGLQTRYAAPLMVAFTIIATLISHRFWEFADAARRQQSVQFGKNVAIIGGFLLLFVHGGGRLSLDGWWQRRGPASRSPDEAQRNPE
jgi:putative oxidoreductase